MSNKHTYSHQSLRLRQKRIYSQLREASPFLRGSICTIKMACTRKGCPSCKTGAKHPATYLSVKRRNKTTLVYLPKAAVPTARRLVKQGERARKLFEDILDCNLDLFRQELAEAKRRK